MKLFSSEGKEELVRLFMLSNKGRPIISAHALIGNVGKMFPELGAATDLIAVHSLSVCAFSVAGDEIEIPITRYVLSFSYGEYLLGAVHHMGKYNNLYIYVPRLVVR